MATSEGIPSSIDIEFLELNDNPYVRINRVLTQSVTHLCIVVSRYVIIKAPGSNPLR